MLTGGEEAHRASNCRGNRRRSLEDGLRDMLPLLNSDIIQRCPEREQFAYPMRLLAATGPCFGRSLGISEFRQNFRIGPGLRNILWRAAELPAEFIKLSLKFLLLNLDFRSQH